MENGFSFTRQDAVRVFWFSAGISALLILAFVIDRAMPGTPRRLLNVDGEGNIPAWFSSVQLFLISAFLFLKAWRAEAGAGASRWFFLLGAAAFLFLSADEAAYIHETITRALVHVEWMPRFKGDHGIWIPIYLGIMALLGLLCWRQVWLMFTHHTAGAVTMAVGMGVFLAGAVGLEIVGYQLGSAVLGAFGMVLLIAAEEFLEMLGNSIMIYGSMLLVLEPVRAKAAQPIVPPADTGSAAA
jgi:hypothetical protein